MQIVPENGLPNAKSRFALAFGTLSAESVPRSLRSLGMTGLGVYRWLPPISAMPDGEEKTAWKNVWAYEHEKGIEHIKAATAEQKMYRA